MLLCKYLIEGYVSGLTVGDEDSKGVCWKFLETVSNLMESCSPSLQKWEAFVGGCVGMRHFSHPLAPWEQILLTAHYEDLEGQEPDSFRDRSAHCERTQAVFQLSSDSEPSTQNGILLYMTRQWSRLCSWSVNLGTPFRCTQRRIIVVACSYLCLTPSSTQIPDIGADGLCLSQILLVLLLCNP